MTKEYPLLYQEQVDGKPTYPGLAEEIFQDAIYGPRIHRRLAQLLADRPDGLNKDNHDWYFGYLVCAYTQTHFGIKNLLNYPAVTQKILTMCFDSNA